MKQLLDTVKTLDETLDWIKAYNRRGVYIIRRGRFGFAFTEDELNTMTAEQIVDAVNFRAAPYWWVRRV